MDRKIFFCESWFDAQRRPSELWTVDQARSAHSNGDVYGVLVDSIEHPYCVLIVGEKFVSVGFMDEFLRQYLTYSFLQVSSRDLFLKSAIYRDFEGDSEDLSKAVSYRFSEDGRVDIVKYHFNPDESESGSNHVDVTGNYVSATKFGEYDDFIRIER